MPINDPEKRREYFRNYMRERRKAMAKEEVKPAETQERPEGMPMLKVPTSYVSNISIYLVDGQYVRDNLWLDFTEGGHDLVYDWIPDNEVWIDFDINSSEVVYVMCHELIERLMMFEGMPYEEAHTVVACNLEAYLRENPDEAQAKFEELLGKQPLKETKSMKKIKTQYKTFRTEVKNVNKEDGTIEVNIPMSTGAVDLSKEVILPSAWDNEYLKDYMKRPVMVSSHDYSDLRKQIGEYLDVQVTSTGLFAKPKYYINQGNEEADWAFNLASKGMAAFSVGFQPIEYKVGRTKDEPAITYTKNQLLEISHVIIPCNQEAMMGARAKSHDPVVSQLIDDVLTAEMRDGEVASRQVHTLETAGTIPAPATKVEVTENTIRIPAPGEEGKHEGCKLRTIDVSKKDGISGLYCVDDKVITTFIFDAEKWDKAKASKWVTEHTKQVELFIATRISLTDMKVDDVILESLGDALEHNLHGPKQVSQKELEDEFDYVLALLEKVEGMNAATRQRAEALMAKIGGMEKRNSDSEMSVEDKVQIAQIIAREIAKHY